MAGCLVRENRSREYFLSREDAAKVLNACPDAQWRLLFALSRFGGLRCPSEHLGLRLSDVDWERGRITVRSPKTEHHEGGGIRTVPIFPELRPYLEEVWDQAPPGDGYVITRYRDKNVNLRTQLTKIIKQAGLAPWPKLFQNLRATRETELAEIYPLHVVCAWIGNSQAVARKHYLQVTEDHFRKATGAMVADGAAASEKLQIPLQQSGTKQCKPVQSKGDNPGNAWVCIKSHWYTPVPVGGTGLEPATSTV
jgi:integrase